MLQRVLHPLFALLASATRQDLACQVAYLKEENRILRARLPKVITVTPRERKRLLRIGQKLGAQLKELISIVCYGTFLRWIRNQQEPVAPRRSPRVSPVAIELLMRSAKSC